ncbi:probable GTP-binding protein OBGC2 isoform X4 [Ananas comosus]|uniref:Probable GTP-binding protein OBGC2 isoform X4 n=1 Tax=Ananas comosus TaxID=4615 RepID=A0A6P5FRA8_ANACO|nr:probable GTP-binding protein OBGC2 isoform X4 [Ananas comosus]
MPLLLYPPSAPIPLQLRKGFSPESLQCRPLLFSTNSGKQWYYRSKNVTRLTVNCGVSSLKEPPVSNPAALAKEAHKYFDQAVITIRAGDSGHGAILSMPNQKINTKSQGQHEKEKRIKSSYKRDSDGSLILPMGGHGGDVVLYADEDLESLLEFHKKRRYSVKRGGNVDAMGALTSQLHEGFAAPALRIPVPVLQV